MKQIDLEAAAYTSAEVADVCVVGAGAVGIVLALQLLRAGRSVVLLESGGRGFEAGTQELYRSDVAGRAHSGIHSGRFRTWGGTTTKWGGQVLEFEEIDFARRAWVPRSGWPIAKSALDEGYRVALEMEGVSGAVQDDAAVWAAVGEAVPRIGEALEPYFTRWCPQPNFALLHGAELAAAPRLTVVLHANLVDFEMELERAARAVCRSLNGNEARVTAREFVLAVGAIETSRLLLHLEEQHGARWNPNGLVGRGFQDHVDCEAVGVRPLDRKRFFGGFTNVLLRGYKYHPKFRLRPEEQERRRTLNVAGTFVFRDMTDEVAGAVKSTGRRILRRAWSELDAAQVLHLVRNVPLLVKQTWSYVVKHRVYNSPDAALSLRVHCEQEPSTGSSVSLAEERDALGVRRVRLHWDISRVELDTIRAFIDVAAEELRASGVAELTPMIDLHDDEALRARCDDGIHHMGGTVMGADPAASVVDTELRLHGVPNVSVCSASVFPTGGYSNPTHTVLALAVRLAGRLALTGE